MLDQLLAWKNKDTRKPLLIDGARLEKVHLVFRNNVVTSKPTIPLRVLAQESHFKLFASDVGLLGAMLNIKGSVAAGSFTPGRP